MHGNTCFSFIFAQHHSLQILNQGRGGGEGRGADPRDVALWPGTSIFMLDNRKEEGIDKMKVGSCPISIGDPFKTTVSSDRQEIAGRRDR